MKKILLIGLPNVGKSTLFNRLITNRVSSGSYPGSSVEVRRGILKVDGEDVEIIDTPGVCNLLFNEDNERVAKCILVEEAPELVVQVFDAKNVNRSLQLTSLLADLQIPLLCAINMVDEAAQKGITVNRHKLEELLGTPVIEIIASEGVGVPTLVTALGKGVAPRFPTRLPATLTAAVSKLEESITTELCSERNRRILAILAMAGDHPTSMWARTKLALHQEIGRAHV